MKRLLQYILAGVLIVSLMAGTVASAAVMGSWSDSIELAATETTIPCHDHSSDGDKIKPCPFAALCVKCFQSLPIADALAMALLISAPAKNNFGTSILSGILPPPLPKVPRA